MLDLTRFADAMTALIGRAEGGPVATSLNHAIAAAGVDLGSLQASSTEQIVATLAGHGIDCRSFPSAELQELVGALGLGSGLDTVTHAVLSSHVLH